MQNEDRARQEIHWQHYDHPTAGHFDNKRTEDLVTKIYFWPGFHHDVPEYCAICAASCKLSPLLIGSVASCSYYHAHRTIDRYCYGFHYEAPCSFPV